MGNLPVEHTAKVKEFLDKARTARGRLIFALDATASRQPTWDSAVELQSQMFAEAGKIGGLEVQLVYYRGKDECKSSRWTVDAYQLAHTMRKIMCIAGETQIGKILAHARSEHAHQAVSALVFVGDAMEEDHGTLCDAAAGAGMPIFVFQEGNRQEVAQTFREIARVTKGAHAQFDAGAAHKLAELLRAVAAFAVGGVQALQDLRTDSARLLLGQMKK
jgi:hypothetical protein